MDFLFDLPVELQLEVTKYLDPESCRAMRLVSLGWNDGIKKIKKFEYLRCELNDQTSSHVLPFPEEIFKIEVNDLSRRKVITEIKPFGVISTAGEITLGVNIHPQVLKKLLKTAVKINTLGLEPLDPRVGEELLKYPAQFDNVTKFHLGLKLSPKMAELKEEEILVRKLSMWRKFPNLLHFSISLNQRDIRTLKTTSDVLAVHSIYTSVHRFLVSHGKSLREFSGDFSNIIVIGFHNYTRNIPEYSRVKGNLLKDLELRAVTIRMNEMEGEDFWDLNETLLRNQFTLEQLKFNGNMLWTPNSVILGTPITIVNEVVEQNRWTLRDLELENKVFSFYSIKNCGELRKLSLKGASIISTTPLTHIDAPKDIEELCLDFKYVFPPDMNNLMAWFPKLWRLKILHLKLKMQWTNPYGFPDLDDFPTFFSAPSLTLLTLSFEVPTGSKLMMVQKKGDAWSKSLEKLEGLSIKKIHYPVKKIFEFNFHLDRKLFRGAKG